jgi:hypothetical protein
VAAGAAAGAGSVVAGAGVGSVAAGAASAIRNMSVACLCLLHLGPPRWKVA